MTPDDINHHTEARIHLELARQVVGHDGTMEHLGFARAHALLAIADRLGKPKPDNRLREALATIRKDAS